MPTEVCVEENKSEVQLIIDLSDDIISGRKRSVSLTL